ncbi:acyl transferase/acyl hydrolase/lysophospholipase [Pyronema domesticum]|nr:acyl transferase/acyl hydrolase/lysophospholipase [Pyronema domesticum]
MSPTTRLTRTLRHARKFSTSPRCSRPKTAMFFPGQGSQKVGMLAPLLESFRHIVTPMLEQLDHTLPPADGQPKLSTVIAQGPAGTLTATENAQPAIMFTSLVILRILEKEFGLSPRLQTDFFLGHSLGEFTALVAAGVLKLEDALLLVRKRGEVMRDCAIRASVPEMEGGPGETGMRALIVEKQFLPGLIRSVNEFMASETLPNDEFLSIANINSSDQIVLSGHLKAINAAICHIRKFAGHDPRSLPLRVSAPFHSMIMAPAVPVVRKMLDGMDINWPPQQGGDAKAVVCNVTARVYESKERLRELLSKQCTATVRWADSVNYLDYEEGVTRWIAIGPSKVAKNLVRREIRGGEDRIVGIEGHNARNIEEAVKLLRKMEEREKED